MKLFSIIPALILAGCAGAPSLPAYRETRQTVAARTGYAIGPESDREIAQAVASVLAQPLNADSAAQIALLNNKELAADFEDVGIAQADWIEAGILKNPALFLGLEFPTSAPSATRIDASFTQSFLDLLTLPRRKKIAEAEFQAVKLRVADEALALVAEAKTQVYRLQADELLLVHAQSALELERASAELARLQHDAGNIADFELSRRQTAYGQLRLEVAKLRMERTKDHENLNRLLGLSKEGLSWQVEAELPHVGEQVPASEDLESLAIGQRLDIAAAKADYAANARVLGLATDYRFTGSLDLGAQFERDVDRQKSLGPTVGLELPIFNRGAVRVARAKARLRQAALRLDGLAVNAQSEVREITDELSLAHDIALLYRDTVVPEQRRLLGLTQERYNGMFVGAYDLVAAKQGELAAERGEIEARRDYWIAWADLEKAVGGNLRLQTANPP